MQEIDWGTLEWALSQADLRLIYSFAQSTHGEESLQDSPIEVGFFWKRGNQNVWSLAVTRETLSELVARLESKKLFIPKEFREALEKFPKERKRRA